MLNLSQCSFIDSSGIHAVLELHNRSTQQSIHLVIIPGHGQCSDRLRSAA